MPDLLMPKGVLTPLITPFRHDTVDDAQLGALIERQIAAGIHGIIVGDQTGEGLALTESERSIILSVAVGSISRSIAVVAAVGTNCTSKTIDIVAATPDSVDALLVTVPYYSKPTVKGIVHHFEKIAETTNLPIIVDDDPARTAKPLTWEILEELRHLKNIGGVRHCGGNISDFITMPPSLKRHFSHYAGDDRTALAYLMTGASSLSSPIANLFPNWVRSFFDLTRAHMLPGENAIHSKLLAAIKALGGLEPPNLKRALSHLVGCCDDVRLPLVSIEENVAVEIDCLLARHISSRRICPMD